MNGFAKLNARANAMVPTWFTDPRKGKLNYYVRMAEGDPDREVTGSQLQLMIYLRPAGEWSGLAKDKELAKRQKAHEEWRIIAPRVASKLRVTLPVDHSLAQPEAFRTWMLDFQLLRVSSGFSGYGGLALNVFDQLALPSFYEPDRRLLAFLLLRHPGFDADGGAVQPCLLRYRPEPPGFLCLIKRVNWLNLVCSDTVTYLGGPEKLRASLPSDGAIMVSDLEHVLVVQAGSAPQIGDVGHHDFVPGYRQLEKALRPARIDDIDDFGGPFRKDASNEWLNAFVREYE